MDNQQTMDATENHNQVDCLEDVDVTETNIEEHAYVNRNNQLDNDNLLGRVVNNMVEAYDLYNEYAIRMGFSVRRSKTRYATGKSKSQEIRQKEFQCSKAGKKIESNTSSAVRRNRFETKSDCKAMIRFTIENGLWVVTHFFREHNHELASPAKAYLLRSNRSIIAPKGNVIRTMVNAGMRTRDVFAYISSEVGGNENVGFIKRDCYNFVSRQKMMTIEAGDAQSLINYFKEQEVKDSMFSYDIQVDQENRLTNFFLRDGKSAVDYDFFGDVVIFDTTYRTNKYNLVCAPFIGVNHHRQNVMFGCAFLLDEKADSFVWLFNAFLNSVGGKAPKTIFTDQDQAMAKAIKIVFPNTSHRLCLWHMAKHFPSHLGCLNSDPEFQSFFKKCLYGCESEDEFEETWEKMLEKFNLKEHKWLNNFHGLRHKWSLAFSNDVFSAGILSTQRSESTNSVLGGIANRTTSLTNFFISFEKVVAGWRSSEAEEDFQCKHSKPPLTIINTGILNHAAKVYTHKIFKLFENEFKFAIGLVWSEISSLNNVYVFEVKARHVKLDVSTMEINCSCKKFESSGLFCSHILKILIVKNFNAIPEKYILDRWSKKARKRWVEGDFSQVNSDGFDIFYHNNMVRYAYDIILKSQNNIATREIFQYGLRKINADIEVELAKLDGSSQGEKVENNIGDDENEVVEPILNLPRVKPKGVSNARLKGYFEKRNTKVKVATKGKKKVKTSLDHKFATSDVPPFQYQFPNSMPPLQYQFPNSMPPLQYQFPSSYWNFGVSNMTYTTMLQSTEHMDCLTSLPDTTAQLRQDLPRMLDGLINNEQ